jgi:hypothetical protein
VAIIVRSHPEGRLTTDRWLLLEEQILKALIREIARSADRTTNIKFEGAKWNKGVKIIGCGNIEALNFLKTCTQSFDDLWPGMSIHVVPIDQIPHQTTTKVWVPPPIMEDEAILTLIKSQNEGLCTNSWRIMRTG